MTVSWHKLVFLQFFSGLLATAADITCYERNNIELKDIGVGKILRVNYLYLIGIYC
ncbi:hypothetical protein BD65_3182 [Yersinia ruckeri]|nr:hypothetical protein BD65_3182 [Yersinia ruckeri]